jgi:hypothetical protein
VEVREFQTLQNQQHYEHIMKINLIKKKIRLKNLLRQVKKKVAKFRIEREKLRLERQKKRVRKNSKNRQKID